MSLINGELLRQYGVILAFDAAQTQIEQRGQHVSQISLTSAVTGMSFIIADAELLVCGFL